MKKLLLFFAFVAVLGMAKAQETYTFDCGGLDFTITLEEYENLSQIDFNSDGALNDADLQFFFGCDDEFSDSDFEDSDFDFVNFDDFVDFLTNNFDDSGLDDFISDLQNFVPETINLDDYDYDVFGDTIVINDTINFNDFSYFYNNIVKSNIQKRELLDIRDLQGRSVQFTPNQPLIYIYNDGTFEKRMTFDR